MPNCYICGKPLRESRTRLRRTVKTGEWIRRNYTRDRADRRTVRFSSRVVCARCARKLDMRDERSDRWQWIQLGIWLIVLLVAMWLL